MKFKVLVILLSFTLPILAQAMDPQAQAYYKSGNESFKANELLKAIAYYDSALITSQDYKIHFQKGICLRKLERNDEAIACFNESIKNSPKFDLAYNALGGTYFALNNMHEAIVNFLKVLEYSSNQALIDKVKEYLARAYNKQANEYINENQIDTAITLLNSGLEYFKLDLAYLSLARAYSKTENWDAVISNSQEALKIKANITPGGPNYYLGMAYRNKGENDKARQYLEIAAADNDYQKLAEAELQKIK